MSKYQAIKDAIEAFQPGGADAPILCSTTEVNEKGFQALLGRKAKSRPMSAAIWICLFVIIAISVANIFAFRQTGTTTFAAFIPMFIVLFFYRTTLVTVGDEGLDFYFVESKRGSTYVVYDKMSLPYNRITNIKVREGRFNTSFTFEFLNETKKYKIKTSVPNKMRKAEEQAENLKHLLEVLQKAS
ncbi:MAG: hypothetical protein FWD25_02260 [Clostridia bacterium]|nr:hypothetical protein [Clostridia bacterium]